MICLAYASTAFSQNLKIVSCVPDKILEVRIGIGGKSQSFKLGSGQDSGGFAIGEKQAKIEASVWGNDQMKTETVIGAGILLIYENKEDLASRLIASAPTPSIFSLRLVNLSSDDVAFRFTGKDHTLRAGGLTEIGLNKKPSFRLTFGEGEKSAGFDVEEPQAILGVITRSGETWRVTWTLGG